MRIPAPACFVPIFLVSFLLSLPWTNSSAESDSQSWDGRPLVVRIGDDDLTEGRRVREIERIVKKTVSDGAEALILHLDLSRDLPTDSLQRVLSAVSVTDVRVIAYVDPIAVGPGALLAIAGDAIYMGPTAIIGGAGSEIADDDDEDAETDPGRVDSVLKARARSLAGIRGHRKEVVEAMIDERKELRFGDEILSEEGEMLTLTADEAVRVHEGAPILARKVVASVEEILDAEALDGEAIEITPREFGEKSNRERLSNVRKEGDSEIGDGDAESGVEEADSLFGKREEGSYEDKVIVLEVGQDTLATGKASFDFMERTLKKAELDGAAAVVFDMDTPGGFAWYTEGLVLNSLQNVTFPTFTFVNSRAESAGAIIALGTDEIYMKPAATIGSALVVSGTGQDLAEDMADKVTQMIIGTVRNVAEINGHNPDVAEAFVTRDKEVKIDGIVIHEAGNVLNLNTIRATEVIGGRPVLAKGVASSIEDLLDQEGFEAEIVEAAPLGMEAFAHWVQKLSILLIVLGLAGAYLELNSPGFGLPGLVSVLAFGVFFFGNYMAGNLAGYELAVLLVLGLLLIAVEIFLFPGALLPGVVGGTLVLSSLGLAMVDRIDLEWKWEGLPGAESWITIFRGSVFALATGMVGSIAVIFLGMRFLPSTRLGSRFILSEAVAGGAALAPSNTGDREGENAQDLVGRAGQATTDLVPSGKGRFDGKLINVVSEGEFIEKGTAVVVAQHEGSRVVVRRA